MEHAYIGVGRKASDLPGAGGNNLRTNPPMGTDHWRTSKRAKAMRNAQLRGARPMPGRPSSELITRRKKRETGTRTVFYIINGKKVKLAV